MELFGRGIGDEADKVKEAVHKAIGGVLLIDEAYSIFDSKGGYGKDVVATFLTEMEDHMHEVSIIFAGYPKEMNQFLEMNPGLRSRIGYKVSFDDYKPEELLEMLIRKCKKIGFEVTEEAKAKMLDVIEIATKYENFGNGRFINNFLESIVIEHAVNTRKDKDREILQTITLDDITEKIIKELTNPRNVTTTIKKGMKLEDLVGLEKVKSQINEFTTLLEFSNQSNISLKDLDLNLHMAFTGNSGTGKTTIAALIADTLSKLGYVKDNKVLSVTTKDLIGEYVGQTAPKTQAVIERAKGGVLFIDEAYALISNKEGAGSSYSQECLSTLLVAMEQEEIVIIFAGYKDEMAEFIRYNPGLRSRIGTVVEFEDYTPEQLTEITLRSLHKRGLSTDNAEVSNLIFEIHQKAVLCKDFGNARFAEQLARNIVVAHAKNNRGCKDMEILFKIFPQDVNSVALSALTGLEPPKKVTTIGFSIQEADDNQREDGQRSPHR